MNNIVTFSIKEETRQRIEKLAHITGKQHESVLRELVETGLKNYKITSTESAQAALDLIAWAEKEKITGKTKNLSTNHNAYAWDE